MAIAFKSPITIFFQLKKNNPNNFKFEKLLARGRGSFELRLICERKWKVCISVFWYSKVSLGGLVHGVCLNVIR